LLRPYRLAEELTQEALVARVGISAWMLRALMPARATSRRSSAA